MSKAELGSMKLTDLNQCLDHIEVSKKTFLMLERRKLKNKKSASETRKKAIIERQKLESEISVQKSNLQIAEERLAIEQERTLVVQEQKKV